jgi:hypothetical protein
MQAITVRDHDAGLASLSLADWPHPHAAEKDVIVEVNAAGLTPGDRDWSATWAGHTRLPARLGDGRLKPVVGTARPLAETPAAPVPGQRDLSKTITRVTED